MSEPTYRVDERLATLLTITEKLNAIDDIRGGQIQKLWQEIAELRDDLHALASRMALTRLREVQR